MKLKRIFLVMLSAVFLLSSGCGEKTAVFGNWQEEIQYKISNSKGDTVKGTDINRTWYEVFVYSFCDSNGDGIGDLKGVTEMLDYIEYMGFNGIWLTPVHPSTTYHKYDVTDYYSIDPEYGTMEDFDELVGECERRGIALIMDLVINHTSSRHEWFKEAVLATAENDSDSKYIGYYNFSEKNGGTRWNAVGNGWFYECGFWSEMPDLNLENPQLRAELEDMFKFWLDKGISGFRLDAVKEYVSGNTQKNIEILSWINEAVKKINPDAYLVGEAWIKSPSLYEYYLSGVDSFFNFNFAEADGKLATALLAKNPNASDYTKALLTAQKNINEKNPAASDANFFTNHDTARAADILRRDENLIKTAWGLNLTQSGDAFVYYGEEIGMSGYGKDQNKRAAMLWCGDKSADGITAGPLELEKADYPFLSVTEQIGYEASILEYIRKAVLLRNKYPEIGAGEISVEEFAENGGIFIVHKTLNGKTISLYYNITSEEKNFETETIPDDWLSATGGKPELKDGALSLPPYTIAVFAGAGS